MKTISLKKVSAVAVASLGFGLLSVVPAHAANIVSVPTMAITAPATANSGTTDVPIAQGTAITIDLGMDATAVYTDAGDGTDVTYVVTNPLGTVITSSVTIAAVAAPATGITATAAGAVVSVRSTAIGGDMATGNAKSIATMTIPATATTVAGFYAITSAVAAVNGAGGTTDTDTTGNQMDGTTSLARGKIFVSGTTVTQGTSRGQNGGATVANSAAVTFATNTHTALTVYKVISTGVGSITSATQNAAAGFPTGTTGIAATSGVAGSFGSGVTLTTANATTSEGVVIGLASTVAGDQTISVYSVNGTTGANTLVGASIVTWGATANASAQFSLLTLNAEGTNPTTATGAAADTTATVVSKTASTTPKFRIQVVIKDQFDVAFPALMGASITGPGNLGVAATNAGTTTNPAGRSLTIASTSVGSVSVYSDGVAGTSVITITATNAAGTTTVLGTKTVKFAGSPAKAALTQNLFVAKAGTQLGATPSGTVGANAATSAATTPAFYAQVMDSNGVDAVSGSTVKMTSSDTAVIVAGTCVETVTAGTPAATNPSAPGNFECSVSGATGAASGKSATITFSVLNSTTGLFDIVATPITFTVGGAIAKTVVTLDKTSYTAGEAMTLIATSTDSSGNPAFDGQNPYTSISSNKSLITLPVAATKEIKSGKASTTSSKGVASLFAPSTSGAFTISGLYTDLATGTAYSVSGSVADGNAALLTQIDALNAKIVALNALIAKIMKKLGVK